MTTSPNRSAGTLDPSFGLGGKAFPTNPQDPNGFAWGLTIDPADKVLIAGRFGWNYAITRLESDGEPDASFGQKGIATGKFQEGFKSQASGITLLTDNKILLTGVFTETEGDQDIPALARFDEYGRLDTSFGEQGTVVVRVPLKGCAPITQTSSLEGRPSNHDNGGTSVLQDGKILLSSNHSYSFTEFVGVLIRLLPDGALDTSFNEGEGFTTVRHPDYPTTITAKLIQSDQKIIVAGTAFTEAGTVALVARYHVNGKLDTSFGNAGFFLSTATGEQCQISGLALQSKGMIVAAGSTLSFPRQCMLWSLTASGTFNPLFNSGKPLITSIDENPGGSEWIAVTVQPDSKIVVQGNTLGGEEADVVLRRYSATGKPDLDFGDETGLVRTKVGDSIDMGMAVGLDTCERIVVAGMYFTAGFRPFVLRYLS